jgi:hypothetical protein
MGAGAGANAGDAGVVDATSESAAVEGAGEGEVGTSFSFRLRALTSGTTGLAGKLTSAGFGGKLLAAGVEGRDNAEPFFGVEVAFCDVLAEERFSRALDNVGRVWRVVVRVVVPRRGCLAVESPDGLLVVEAAF